MTQFTGLFQFVNSHPHFLDLSKPSFYGKISLNQGSKVSNGK